MRVERIKSELSREHLKRIFCTARELYAYSTIPNIGINEIFVSSKNDCTILLSCNMIELDERTEIGQLNIEELIRTENAKDKEIFLTITPPNKVRILYIKETDKQIESGIEITDALGNTYTILPSVFPYNLTILKNEKKRVEVPPEHDRRAYFENLLI